MTATLTNRSRTTDETPGARARELLVAAGPVLLTAALLWHPPLPGRLPDSAGVADAASADITRWGLSHVAAALAFGAVAVARAASFARLPTVIVAGALVVFGLSRVVPVGGVQFHVQSVAALVALLPLAVAIGAARQGAGTR